MAAIFAELVPSPTALSAGNKLGITASGKACWISISALWHFASLSALTGMLMIVGN